MNIRDLVQKLTPDAEVELFEIELTPITGTDLSTDHIYCHSGTTLGMAGVVWQGKTYNPMPIEVKGFDKSIKGTLPRPTMTVANVTGIMTAANNDYQDLIGAKVYRRRTFARYLDGAAEADPNVHKVDDMFYIDRKVSENSVAVTWELVSAMDLEGVMLPRRPVIANYCPWVYRSAECSYAAAVYFDINNLSAPSLALDVCNKQTSGCKIRFGATAILPFGGFPAAKVYKL